MRPSDANWAAVPVRTETRRVFVAERTVWSETRDCDGGITDVYLATQRRTFLSEHAAWLWVARGALFVRRAEACGGRCGDPRPPDGEPDFCRYCDERRWRPLVARYARLLRRRARLDAE